jgi:hypothetical protein
MTRGLGALGRTLLVVACSCAGLLVASCSSQYAGSTLGQQVHSWATTSPDPKFADAVSTIQGEFQQIARAVAAGDTSGMRAVCDVLVTDALRANQNLPTPDQQLTQVLSHAYSSAVSAGQDCFCAAGGRPCRKGATSTQGYLDRSAIERSEAERGLVAAQARVDLLSILSSNPNSGSSSR